MLTQSWRDVAQPTEKNLFLLANPGVSTTRVQRWPEVPQPTFVIWAILYVGPTLAQRWKAKKIKGTDFLFSSNTRLCSPNVGPHCAPNAANGTKVCQRCPNIACYLGELFTAWDWPVSMVTLISDSLGWSTLYLFYASSILISEFKRSTTKEQRGILKKKPGICHHCESKLKKIRPGTTYRNVSTNI